MWQFETELSKVIVRTPSIRTFRFPVRAYGFRYLPGQFLFVTIKVRGGEAEHHISFSSSPTEKGYFEFTKRITNSDFSQALAVMQPGAWARVFGPSGDFTLSRKFRKLGFLSGGIGITPLRSMLRYVADKGLGYDIVLLFGNPSVEEIAFKEELDSLGQSSPGVKVVHVLSGPVVPPGWKGRTGLVSSALVAEEIPDYMERLFYVSGPPSMVLALESQLKQLGVPGKQVKRDSFTGYD